MGCDLDSHLLFDPIVLAFCYGHQKSGSQCALSYTKLPRYESLVWGRLDGVTMTGLVCILANTIPLPNPVSSGQHS